MPSLIIVESPAKAKTISTFLPKDYIVRSSLGHLCDLPKYRMAIEVTKESVKPNYEVSRNHKKIIHELIKIAKTCQNKVILATDEDREGEAISWHICNLLNLDIKTTPRIAFHEITKDAILKALSNPRNLDMDSVNSQQARRCLDRLIGYNLSPLIKIKIGGKISAGRVQSVALKIVVEREREIRGFKSIKYYDVPIVYKTAIPGELYSYQNKKIDRSLPLPTIVEAESVLNGAKKVEHRVKNIEDKEFKKSPQPPFITSTLQQSASNRLGFSTKKTMTIAQSLYEGISIGKESKGLITYMRTDSVSISEEASMSLRKYIAENYGGEYLHPTTRKFSNKSKNAQEAHEAIRPTDVNLTPDSIKGYLTKDQYELYKLIYKRFLATQMSDSISKVQNLYIGNDIVTYKVNGRKILFKGYTEVYDYGDNTDIILPVVNVGDIFYIEKIEVEEKETKPPTRYSEAGLVKKLEELGIGRPSTYSPTISLLKSREYISLENKSLRPTKIGEEITEILENDFPDVINYEFTANMESQLDLISNGKIGWEKVIIDFYLPFKNKVNEKKSKFKVERVYVEVDKPCPTCKVKLIIRRGRYGEFCGCPNYPKCRYIEPLGNSTKKEVEVTKIDCPSCSSGKLVIREANRTGKVFYGCMNFPKCKYVEKITDNNS